LEHVPGTLRLSFDVALDSAAAFDALVTELADGLRRLGIAFEPGLDGRVSHGGGDVGSVVDWRPGERCLLRWRPAPWQAHAATEVEVRVEPADSRSSADAHGPADLGRRGDAAPPAATRLVLEHRGWGALLEDGAEAAGWFATAVAAPLLSATARQRCSP